MRHYVIEAMRRGVRDVLVPARSRSRHWSRHLQRAAAVDRGWRSHPRAWWKPGRPRTAARELIGDSAQMRQVRDLIQSDRAAARHGADRGRYRHRQGTRSPAGCTHCSARRGAFVAVNCGAIAPELLESELFGHTKGAFTSAHQVREGLFVAARGGTLYLDEISEMPLSLEVKLLRVLEEGTRSARSGADHESPRGRAHRRLDAARPARAGARKRRFREDLYFRLNVAQVSLPPLRERREDLPVLARHFMELLSAEPRRGPAHAGCGASWRMPAANMTGRGTSAS
jgi:hypothetical protein